jgi:hypothetical protein
MYFIKKTDFKLNVALRKPNYKRQASGAIETIPMLHL